MKGFKKCCISNAVKRMGISEVSVRKMKALTMKMEMGTMTGKGRKNLTCFVY